MNPSTQRLIEDIRSLDIKPGEVERLEQCESITNLIIEHVLEYIADEELVEYIKWLQDVHSEPNEQRWRNVAMLTESLFDEVGGAIRVKEYHALERPCMALPDEELEAIPDIGVRETVWEIKHIHERTQGRMTHLVEQCYYK